MEQKRRRNIAMGLQLLVLAVLILIGWIVKFTPNVWHTVHVLVFCGCVFVGVALVMKKSD